MQYRYDERLFVRMFAPVIAAAFLAGALAGCGSGDGDSDDGDTNVDYSKLSSASLVGTWRHQSFGSTPSADQESVDSDISWSFRDDGTGTYTQKNEFSDAESDYDWTLDGKDIKFGNQLSYSVESYSKDEMIWRNHKNRTASGKYYRVTRE